MHDLVTRLGTSSSAPDVFFFAFFSVRNVVQLASEGPSNIVKFLVFSKKWETVSFKNANCNQSLVARSGLTTNGLTGTEVFD